MTKNQDLLAGGLFLLLGVGASLSSLSYALGTVRRMGPGYFPLLLGLLLAGLGVALMVQAWRKGTIEPVEWGSLKPPLFVLGGLALFGLTLSTAGFVVANALFIGVTSYAGREFRLREAVLLATILTGMAVLVFVIGLNLQIPLWPAFTGL